MGNEGIYRKAYQLQYLVLVHYTNSPEHYSHCDLPGVLSQEEISTILDKRIVCVMIVVSCLKQKSDAAALIIINVVLD